MSAHQPKSSISVYYCICLDSVSDISCIASAFVLCGDTLFSLGIGAVSKGILCLASALVL